jgi:hypothetical protein
VRWAPLSGIAFVACFVLAVALFGSGAGSRPAEIAEYYANHGDRIRQVAGFYVLGVALPWSFGLLGFPVAASLVAAW